MARTFGAQSMHEPLLRVLVKRPDEAFGNADPRRWHYSGRPDLETARAEHDAFVALLRESGAEVAYQDNAPPGGADAIFTHDPTIVTDRGAIVLNMGKAERREEPDEAARALEGLGVPILHRLGKPARAEGGDLLWVAQDTLAVGVGSRTNRHGLEELTSVLEPHLEVLPIPMPACDDPHACLHLMSFVSCVDRDLAVVYRPMIPPELEATLERHGYHLVEVPEAEYPTMGANVLALGPRDCLMLDGNPITRTRLEAAGCRVKTYRGNEISLKAEGGPTCLTRPVLRGQVPLLEESGTGSVVLG